MFGPYACMYATLQWLNAFLVIRNGGEVVVKIFPKHDASIQLGKFEKELDSKLVVFGKLDRHTVHS